MTQPYNHTLDPTQRMTYEATPDVLLAWSSQYNGYNILPFNEEIETYLSGNRFVSNNELILEGRNTGGGNPAAGYSGKYTSGMCASYNTMSFLYGYVEACIKFPAGYGIWPAFWALYTSYPAINEIDICEIFESGTSLNSGVHFPGGITHDGGATTVTDMSQGYHYYAVDWRPTYVQFYFDGMPLNRITTAGEIPSQLMYILLNVAISGVAVNGHVPADSQFPLDMHVQYVRIWQGYGSQYQLVLTPGVPSYGNYNAAILLSGASDHWYLNDLVLPTAHDSITPANNGTIVGGVTLAQTALTGDGSKSMLFDGSSGYVTIPNVSPAGWFAFTAIIWFAYPATHHGGRLFDNAHTDATNTGFQMSLDGTNGGLASLATTNKTANLYWSTAFVANTPYCYILTYDGGHVYAYCNGVQVGNDTLTGAIVASGLPLNIGRGSYNNDYWQGLAAKAAIFPMTVSAATAMALYTAGRATPVGPALAIAMDASLYGAVASDRSIS